MRTKFTIVELNVEGNKPVYREYSVMARYTKEPNSAQSRRGGEGTPRYISDMFIHPFKSVRGSVNYNQSKTLKEEDLDRYLGKVHVTEHGTGNVSAYVVYLGDAPEDMGDVLNEMRERCIAVLKGQYSRLRKEREILQEKQEGIMDKMDHLHDYLNIEHQTVREPWMS